MQNPSYLGGREAIQTFVIIDATDIEEGRIGDGTIKTDPLGNEAWEDIAREIHFARRGIERFDERENARIEDVNPSAHQAIEDGALGKASDEASRSIELGDPNIEDVARRQMHGHRTPVSPMEREQSRPIDGGECVGWNDEERLVPREVRSRAPDLPCFAGRRSAFAIGDMCAEPGAIPEMTFNLIGQVADRDHQVVHTCLDKWPEDPFEQWLPMDWEHGFGYPFGEWTEALPPTGGEDESSQAAPRSKASPSMSSAAAALPP
jgi:hypothetical protein